MENVLVKFDKFVFLVDFVILDTPEDINISLILRQTILPNTHNKIDVIKRRISLRVGDENIVFDCEKSIGFPSTPFYYVETIDALVCESMQDIQEEFGALKIDEDLFMYEVPLCKAYEGMSS